MFKLIGIISVILVVCVLISTVSILSGSGFIVKYATDQSLQVMATALALNIATISFITGNFLSLERKAGKMFFNETRKELRQNVLAMVITFLINFAVVAGIGTETVIGSFKLDDILSVFSTFLTILFGALIVEVSMLVLKNR